MELMSKCKDEFKSRPLITSLAVLGGAVVASKACYVLSGIWKYLIRPRRNLFKTYGGDNCWAIITGGSSGIGLSYAKELAKAGFNLILIARNKENLENKKGEILKEIGSERIQIETVSFDFSQPYSQEYYKILYDAIKDKDIAILVNNVGTDHGCEFEEFTNKILTEMLNVNINSVTYFTHMVLPIMLKRKKRSAIINVSSSFSTTYCPYFQFYIATKSYMNTLMNCLHDELKEKGIDVLTGLAGEVLTPRNPMRTMWHATSETVVKGQLAALGREKITSGILRHAFYGIYLRSVFSCRFKKWLGNTVRDMTLKELKHE